ncbi:MAG TPA: ABC transporter substrate-binding protein, partial [Candidatus Binatia bacterium]|nr:ABC transporter substrate-binding protein [Candidatus Binatia bacterium]
MKAPPSDDVVQPEDLHAHQHPGHGHGTDVADWSSAEVLIDQAVERVVASAVFGSDIRRREFLRYVGVGTAYAILNSVFPLDAAKALAQEKTGSIEKKDLKVGFIPITCATPIIMAEPMGFYKKHGLNVQVHKASGWAMIRDLAI